MSYPGSARALSVILTVALIAACSSGKASPENDPASPATFDPTTPAPDTEQEAFALMPLDGVGDTHLHWETGIAEMDTDFEAAIKAAQANRALDYYRYTLGALPDDLHLYQWTTKPESVGIADVWLFGDDYFEDPGHGEVWIWVQHVEHHKHQSIKVLFCEDVGWWEQRSRQRMLPRSAATNPLLTGFIVTHDLESSQWLVDGAAIWPMTDPEYADPCEDWANHEPTETG
ncbi:hypothetical protein JQS43_20350 [Natronosporangium hydrolyticum]|uniref:Lipoprotein n=1 Tax=Natronosporangium hydrolyticum TaxID=2811111 RepID=A0A895YJC1_9ACTN|nr:hypothetical protein [Natronosporangium hydrolyticum]QSB13878.1 hypothetical protein JQS43_20350 [Natronosporangium hydrolyticum]